MEFVASLILLLALSSLFLSSPAQATPPTGTIQRTTKQPMLLSVPPGTQENTVPFITSPSVKYTAYLVCRETAPGAGGFGNDFCYIQVQDTSTERSMWESECAPVSTANTCAVVFSDNVLEVFDGSNSAWATDDAESADENFLGTLELADEGDMWIRDKEGELAWKASDNPLQNQGCGSPGSQGLVPEVPPFAAPIVRDDSLPFGQPAQGNRQQQQTTAVFNQQQQLPVGYQQQRPLDEVKQPFGFNVQPLVDNTPFESGCSKGMEGWLLLMMILGLLALFGNGFVL